MEHGGPPTLHWDSQQSGALQARVLSALAVVLDLSLTTQRLVLARYATVPGKS